MKIDRTVRAEVAERIKALQAKNPRFQPQLAIIQAGARPDSSVYVRMKSKAAEEVGIKFKHVPLPEEAQVDEIVETIQKLKPPGERTSGGRGRTHARGLSELSHYSL